jgi:hypothetical protein
MNKNTKLLNTAFLSILALGLAASASAQADSAAAAPAAPADPGPGLVGTNYAEVSTAYQRQGDQPGVLHDYQFVTNTAFYKQANAGVDANFTFDTLRGSAAGFSDHRDEALFGLTGYTRQSWGLPYVTADAGMAWQRTGDVSRKGFAFDLTGGVEFQVARDLELSPFIGYEAEPHLYNHEAPVASLPDHLFDYGLKATYRITSQWKASATADLDQHSARDWGLRAGVAYGF